MKRAQQNDETIIIIITYLELFCYFYIKNFVGLYFVPI